MKNSSISVESSRRLVGLQRDKQQSGLGPESLYGGGTNNAGNSTSGKPVKRGVNIDFYSPKKVAAAIGVSESSLKRWCDAGYIDAIKTEGGHRRVARSQVLEFIRKKNYELRDPTAIGLPDIRTVKVDDDQHAIAQVVEALKSGDETSLRKLLSFLFINGRTVPDLFDRIVAPAFVNVGDLWQCGDLDVYQERYACRICFQAALDVRSLIPQPSDDAPVAIGCTFQGDFYELATLGVEMSLMNFGWNSKSLGTNIPPESLFNAFLQHKPKIVWVSVSHIENRDYFVRSVNHLVNQIGQHAKLIIGGRELTEATRAELKGVVCCNNFAQMIVEAQITL